MLNRHPLLVHLLAYIVMVLASFLLFRPYFLEDKVLSQGDNQRARAMQTEITHYRQVDGHAPQWTNAMFSGMPAYMIWHTAQGNVQQHLGRALLWFHGITEPQYVVLLAMLMGYLALLTLGVDWRIGLIGGISYGISTYFIDLAEAGHSTKMLAMAYVPGVWAGAILLLRKHWLMGLGLMAVMTTLQIQANHVQITYYTFLLLGIGLIIHAVHMFRNGELKAFLISVGLMAAATGLGVASNLAMLWPTWEYSKETIRGKSDLPSKAGQREGLTREYAFDWSYGIGESSTLLVPNAYGGGASQTFKGTETYRRVFPNIVQNYVQQGMSRQEATRNAEQQVSVLFYHGEQPFVGVAIYFGAALVFLFILGFLITTGPVRWWLLISALFALSLAWGKHFFLNDILFDYFPLFNKFRAVSMALGLSHLAMVLLAMTGLHAFLKADKSPRSTKALYSAAGIAASLVLLIFLAGSLRDLSGANDEKVGAELTRMLLADRASILRTDALRSLLVILLTAGILWAWVKDKLKLTPTLLLAGLVILGDVWLVDNRILFPEKYEPRRQAEADPVPSAADRMILDDTDPYFRVLDLRGNPFTNAQTSLFHKSVGGYHAAKLMRYQELIEAYLQNPGQNLDIFGMLNTKYIIQSSEDRAVTLPPDVVLGNAWFVDTLVSVQDADAELASLKSVDLHHQAVIGTGELPEGWSATPGRDSTASIRLTRYHPDTLTYHYSAANPGFVVFSEVYYPPAKGWKLYLNGQPYPDFIKVNYLLRGVQVPAGRDQELMMVFHPTSVYAGQNVAMAGSLAGLILLVGGLFLLFRRSGLPEARILEDAPSIQAKPMKRGKA